MGSESGRSGTLVIRCPCGLVRGEHHGPCCQEVSMADPAAWLLASQTFAVGKGPHTLALGRERLENTLQEGRGETGRIELN